ncbi:hypothetical protein CWO92_21165 [Heyndrickxia camelliae]|uniref:Uncharacterized protein n=1 Tax=Heyndrickxia camelliae TaxID=1707093 RepID=A0A2N3LEM2_9BACI|nr:hypothetical protein CWO92_21165 [Heyndrickxia camelliae]
MIEKEKYINDLSPIQGVYSDFVFLKEYALVSIIRVQGINMDLLSMYQQDSLFDEYGAFLTQNVHYYPQTVSMSVPIKIGDYLRKWKKQYLRSMHDPNCPEKLRQLRASYLYEFQLKETNLEMAKKEHFIILKEKLKKGTVEFLEEAEKRLRQKTEEVKNSIHQVLEQYDGEEEVLSASEALKVLHQLLDYKMSIYE